MGVSLGKTEKRSPWLLALVAMLVMAWRTLLGVNVHSLGGTLVWF